MPLKKENKIIDDFENLILWLNGLDFNNNSHDPDEIEDLQVRINAIRNQLNYSMGHK